MSFIPRADRIATTLLDSPEPDVAIAHEVADQHCRIDALIATIDRLNQIILRQEDRLLRLEGAPS